MAPPPGIVEVRCAGCGETLDVEGLTEFACPDYRTHQALPPELLRGAPAGAPAAAPPPRAPAPRVMCPAAHRAVPRHVLGMRRRVKRAARTEAIRLL
jgi:hypothetical protein